MKLLKLVIVDDEPILLEGLPHKLAAFIFKSTCPGPGFGTSTSTASTFAPPGSFIPSIFSGNFTSDITKSPFILSNIYLFVSCILCSKYNTSLASMKFHMLSFDGQYYCHSVYDYPL